MASDVVYDAIRTFLVSNWTTTPIHFENEARPTQQNEAGDLVPWVALEISGNLYSQQSIGAGNPIDDRWDEEGKLWLHVFVPAGSGSSDARRIAKQLCDLFRGLRLLDEQNLEFMDASIGLGSTADDKGAWFGISTSIDWRRWEA